MNHKPDHRQKRRLERRLGIYRFLPTYVAPVTLSVLACGLLVCLLVERFHLFGYGTSLPEPVREGKRSIATPALAAASRSSSN